MYEPRNTSSMMWKRISDKCYPMSSRQPSNETSRLFVLSLSLSPLPLLLTCAFLFSRVKRFKPSFENINSRIFLFVTRSIVQRVSTFPRDKILGKDFVDCIIEGDGVAITLRLCRRACKSPFLMRILKRGSSPLEKKPGL